MHTPLLFLSRVIRCRNLFLFAVCILWGFTRASAAMELWESQNGHKVKAEFVRITEGAVELKKDDGLTVQVPLNILTDASRKKAEERWQKFSRFVPRQIFQMQTYDLSLFEDGSVKLQPKYAGRPQGDLLNLRFNGGYSTKGQGWTSRNAKNTPEAVVTANSIVLNMVLDDEVKVTVQFELKPDTLTVGYQVTESAGIQEGRYQIVILMPPLLESEPETQMVSGPFLPQPIPYATIGTYLKDISVRAVTEKETIIYPYNDSAEEFKGKHKYVLVSNALGAGSKFRVEAGKNGYVGQWHYPGKMLWHGYHLFLEKNVDSAPVNGSSNQFNLKFSR